MKIKPQMTINGH